MTHRSGTALRTAIVEVALAAERSIGSERTGTHRCEHCRSLFQIAFETMDLISMRLFPHGTLTSWAAMRCKA